MSQLAGEGTLLAIRVSQVAKSAIEETLMSGSDLVTERNNWLDLFVLMDQLRDTY